MSVEDIPQNMPQQEPALVTDDEWQQMEQVIADFIDGNYDVLVCTSIIENGIDISNTNTIIITKLKTSVWATFINCEEE